MEILHLAADALGHVLQQRHSGLGAVERVLLVGRNVHVHGGNLLYYPAEIVPQRRREVKSWGGR